MKHLEKKIKNQNIHQMSNRGLHWPVILSISLLFISSCANRQNSSADNDEGLNALSNIVSETIEDGNIIEVVEREFKLQDGVHASGITVACREGLLTLRGTTDNLLEKERAIAISKMVRGVRGVIDEMKVVTGVVEDEVIRKNIERVLQRDPATDSYEITVEVENGVVNLKGVVDSWQEKQLAAKVAKGVTGLKEVQNNIIFKFRENRTDAEIQSDIEEAMKWDIRVDNGLVDVEVKDGKAVLSGVVGSVAEHSQAVVDAWVAGVNSVNSDGLKVERWARDEDLIKDKYMPKADEAIEEAIGDAFAYDSRIHPFQIDVEVVSGSVSLSGAVDNLKAKKAAEMVAKNVVGVWKVENNLQVKVPSLVADSVINRRIQESFKSDPFIYDYDLSMTVAGGTVTLEGNVDNHFEKYRAENIAMATNGVYDVRNDINVDAGAKPYAYDFEYFYYNPYLIENNVEPHVLTQDSEITASIKDEFAWSPFVSNERIDVEVENGVATLSGNVKTWIERERAEQKAYDGGAIVVDNQIEVSNRPSPLVN